MTRPLNYYQMSYDEQRAYKAHEAEIESLQYERDRAREEMEQCAEASATARARQARERREEAWEWAESFQDLQARFDRIFAELARLIGNEAAERVADDARGAVNGAGAPPEALAEDEDEKF